MTGNNKAHWFLLVFLSSNFHFIFLFGLMMAMMMMIMMIFKKQEEEEEKYSKLCKRLIIFEACIISELINIQALSEWVSEWAGENVIEIIFMHSFYFKNFIFLLSYVTLACSERGRGPRRCVNISIDASFFLFSHIVKHNLTHDYKHQTGWFGFGIDFISFWIRLLVDSIALAHLIDAVLATVCGLGTIWIYQFLFLIYKNFEYR